MRATSLITNGIINSNKTPTISIFQDKIQRANRSNLLRIAVFPIEQQQ
jgi:hypothetical protein